MNMCISTFLEATIHHNTHEALSVRACGQLTYFKKLLNAVTCIQWSLSVVGLFLHTFYALLVNNNNKITRIADTQSMRRHRHAWKGLCDVKVSRRWLNWWLNTVGSQSSHSLLCQIEEKTHTHTDSNFLLLHTAVVPGRFPKEEECTTFITRTVKHK